MSLDDFLKTYYKQTHFNAMPSDVRKRFDGFIKNDSLTDTMRIWRDKYMHLDNGKYVENELPDVTKEKDFPEDIARELFVVCQNALVGMNGKLSSFKDKDPLSAAFVNEYFGDGNLFNISPAKPDCDRGIKEIIALIKSNASIKKWLYTPNENGKKVFDNENTVNEFLKKCDNEDYNKKGNVQAKVREVADAFQLATWHGVGGTPLEPIGDLQYLDYVVAGDAFSMDPASVDTNKLQDFRKNIAHKTGILQTLYRSKNIRDQFAQHDNGTITNIISKAEDEIDYQKKDSANYVAPKLEDALTPLQQLQKWCGDTYSDVFKKYEELRGAPLFFFTESEDIFKAIDKEKIKPSDGLNAVLDKASAIQGRLANSPKAKLYFDWFVETINAVKNDIPKSVAGAWKDGKQMRNVIDKIILRAADPKNDDPHAMQKAMVAMEIMNAMKYGVLTSKIMDAMKQTDFSIFSDKDLSWNKNDGIKFVTAALDKSIKAAFLGIGYGVTFVRNKIMLSKSRTNFKNKHNQEGTLGNAFQEQEDILKSQDKIQKKNLRNEISNLRQEKKDIKQELTDLATDGIDRHTIKSKETDVKNYKTTLGTLQGGKDSFDNNVNIWNKKVKLEKDLKTFQQEAKNLELKVQEAEKKFKNSANYKDMPTLVKEEKEKELYNAWQNLKNELEEKRDQITATNNELTSKKGDFDAAQIYIKTHRNDNITYKQTEKDYNSLKEKTEKFRTATENLKEKNTILREKNTAMKNWGEEHFNKVVYLEKFWNALQNGDTKSYGISAKAAQKDFTANRRDILLQNIFNQHDLAA